MNGRLVSGFVALLVLVPVTLGLLMSETHLDPKQEAAAAASTADALSTLVYMSSARQGNLTTLGFDDKQAAKVLEYLDAYSRKLSTDDPEKSIIGRLLAATDDTEGLENALCGRVDPARYTALQLLVEEQQGNLRVRDLSSLPRFDKQSWYDKDHPTSLAGALDVIPDRQPDATRMALGAVFARQVTTALDHRAPWGQGLFNGWSWDEVVKSWPGTEEKVERYVALFHLVMENVNADGGFCRTQ